VGIAATLRILRQGRLGAALRRAPWLSRAVWLWYWRLADRFTAFEPPLFAQMRRLGVVHRRQTAAQTRTVLFVGTRQERDQVTITTILAEALELRGHRTIAVHCDREIPWCCDTGSYPGLRADQCEVCFRVARKVRDLSGLDTRWLSSYVGAHERAAAREMMDGVADDDMSAVTFDGLPIGEIVRHSVAHFLRTDAVDDPDPVTRQTYRTWSVGAIALTSAWRRVLEDIKPDAIVMLSGYFMPERICLELARRMNIHVVTYEIGTGSETLVFDHDRGIDYDMAWEWMTVKDRPLRPDQIQRVRDRLAVRRVGGGHVVSYWTVREDDPARVAAALALDERPTAVLYTNVVWDSAIFGKDLFFPNMESWVLWTIEWFRDHPEFQLVVRAHPAEAVYPSQKSGSVAERIRVRVGALPQNVRLVDPTSSLSSYQIANEAQVALVYASTMGLELAAEGLPVIVSGDVHYRGKGFTDDPRSIDEYSAMLASRLAMDSTLTEPQLEQALRYAHYFFFELGRPIRFLSYERASEMPALRITSQAALEPGVDPVLDRICAAIVDGGSFLVD
jgi:hypothetical protein